MLSTVTARQPPLEREITSTHFALARVHTDGTAITVQQQLQVAVSPSKDTRMRRRRPDHHRGGSAYRQPSKNLQRKKLAEIVINN